MPTANTIPLAVGTPSCGVVVLSAANTNRDGTTGAYTTLYTAGTSGGMINRVRVQHMGTSGAASTAMVCRLWRTSGATTVLEDEIALASATPSTTAVGATATFTKGNYQLKAGDILKVSQTVAESVGYVADQGGDF